MRAPRTEETGTISFGRHVRAIALLPFMNTVVIPAALLAAASDSLAHVELRGALAAASTVAGAALLAAGVALTAHSVALFVRRGRGTLAPWDPARTLLTAGAYRHCRNPLKAGLFTILAAEALLLRSPVLLVWFACFASANALYIRVWEEPDLARRFGESYRAYCAAVPRWWPRTARASTARAAGERA
jgi:protein-S-isoprenylcysteine O-methyltransferase Ste14